jgi:hypothetical protein
MPTKRVRRRKRRKKSLQRTTELTPRRQRTRQIRRIQERVVGRLPHIRRGKRRKRKGRRGGDQSGGGNWCSSGSFGCVIHNIIGTVESSMGFVFGGIEAVKYAFEFPSDLYYHTGKSSQPTTDSAPPN